MSATVASRVKASSLRIRSRADFRRVFQQGQRSTDGLFSVLFRANGLEQPRLGLAVGRKRLRRAVRRNLVKRLVRESFRQNVDRLDGLDVVVVARLGPGESSGRIRESLAAHWQRIAERR